MSAATAPGRQDPTRNALATSDPEHWARSARSALHATLCLTAPARRTAGPPSTGPLGLEHTAAGAFDVCETRLPGRWLLEGTPDRLIVTEVLEGRVHCLVPAQDGTGPGPCTAGDVVLAAVPGIPFTHCTRDLRTRSFALPMPLLHHAARASAGPGPLVFHTRRADTGAARLHWHATTDYLTGLLRTGPGFLTDHLAAGAGHLLAAAVLTLFPNTHTAPGSTQRPHLPPSVRRAAAFVEQHAGEPITLADIAAHVHLTPRALQYAFRHHLGTSPLAHLRDVRLHRAHLDLLDADPCSDTVHRIAARWGFPHPSRFAARYRAAYHCAPSTTLGT
ncbi:helix-turn-helix transcriptional regulator [Kitasatospora sp. NPDC001540]|uniref:helix-turn-helix transcriptional regulator n=1 Tax=Kitasatospora sp. NPDC001540 TaxID=3364014 RepID=UPI0036A52FEF